MENVKIVEVGPRDGLQNESVLVSTADKTTFITKLLKAGLENIEITSFVNPKAVPQMKDSSKIYESLKEENEKFNFSALVPNLKGMELALNAGAKEIAVFSATSESFNKKNINATNNESFKRIEDLLKIAPSTLKIRGYVSTAFGCPYEGVTEIKSIVEATKKLLDLGCYEVSLGDTIGAANPSLVKKFLAVLKAEFDFKKIALHFHDTRAMGIANVYQGLESGIRTFDSSAAGLGGCPFANGATGNIATEDLSYLLESEGFKTGVDQALLHEASKFILDKLSKSPMSKYYIYQSRKK